MVKNQRISVTKASVSVMLLLLAAAVLFGILTRSSYQVYNKSYNPDDAQVFFSQQIMNEAFENLDSAELLNETKMISSAFVVTVEKNETINRATKSTVLVNRVIKGDQNLLGSKIAIHQINHVKHDQRIGRVIFDNVGFFSNVMQEGRQYLVFADKVDFYEEFQNKLECYEFITRPDIALYYFPTDSKVEYMEYIPEKYGDMKSLDYLCFNQKNAQKIQMLVDDILEYYL